MNLTIVNNSSNYQQFSFHGDSVFLAKGISIFSKTLSLQDHSIDPYKDTLLLQLKVRSVTSNLVIDSSEFSLFPKVTQWASILISDSSLSIIPTSNNRIQYSIHSSPMIDSLDSPIRFTCKVDTVISWRELILSDPFQERELELIQKDKEGKEKKQIFYYKNGRFLTAKKPEDPTQDSIALAEKKKAIQLKGSIAIESNFFRKVPQHSNGSQYPFTSFQASNTISIFGLPFSINATHSTNDNISPNFRNFFSFQFDVASYREQIQQQLLDKERSKLYSFQNVMKDIESNKAAIGNLEQAKELLLRYPNEEVNIDSILSNEWNQIDLSQKTDSLFLLDSLNGDSLEAPTALLTQHSMLDSTLIKNEEKLQQIQNGIDRLKRSNELKEKYLSKIPSKTPSLPADPHALFSEFEGNQFVSTLLRFEKFELGNFYEFAGQYSIRDIEMRGVNTSFLLHPENKINLLYGKVNNFQSFNLDDLKDHTKVTSFSFSNTHFEFFRPTARITQFKDETINSELSESANSYYIMSLTSEGEVSSFASYVVEVNQSNLKLEPTRGIKDGNGKNMSYFFQSYFTPLSFLDVKLQFDQVGSNYQSDGVYFLNRNSQAYTAGVKLRLFKNKVHLKNDFSVIHRNFEQKSLTNKTQKQFYDVGTHFKKIPNLQVSYAPISVEVANQLDTSFSGLDANTNVLIARLFYVKKVKKTFISTAFVYNEIENELADNFSTQKGIQHFISISNEKINFSFTSSYDKTFASVRFISSNYSQKISNKLSAAIHLAKNFNHNFYSEIIRSEFTYQLFKQFNLGAGAIFLVENQNKAINSGGSISLRVNY